MTLTRTSTDMEYTTAVAREFCAHGTHAEAWHTGGGVWCVAVMPPAGGFWLTGIGDVTWGGCFYPSLAAYDASFATGWDDAWGGITTDVSSDDEHTSRVVAALRVAMERHAARRTAGERGVWTSNADEVKP